MPGTPLSHRDDIRQTLGVAFPGVESSGYAFPRRMLTPDTDLFLAFCWRREVRKVDLGVLDGCVLRFRAIFDSLTREALECFFQGQDCVIGFRRSRPSAAPPSAEIKHL